MVASLSLSNENLQSIADDVARSLSRAMVDGHSAFISTAVNYLNGTSVVVRIDQHGDTFFVSDDGQANLSVELFGGVSAFSRIASDVAKRFAVEFDQRSFFILQVRRNQLPAAVAIIANASSIAVDRAIQALDRQRVKVSKEIFLGRISEAFGEKAIFDAQVRGTSKNWDVDVAVISEGLLSAVFEFVTPALPSIAFAHMKMGDISAMHERPKTVIVLADYEKTEAPMRQILSGSVDKIFAAKATVAEYRSAA